jgi:glucosamine-6-phosphate deaminase
MEVVILNGSKQIAQLAADAIEELLRRKPEAVPGACHRVLAAAGL